MKIVVFSINPVFPDLITGGASKHLYHVTHALGQEGHQVLIMCARGNPGQDEFNWTDNVHVSPVLPFKIPFPQPYAISGADLGLIVDRIAKALENADRFYMHDGEFLVPDIYREIPTTISFRDNIYPESVMGTFIGKADDVISVSEYSAEVIKYTAGRYLPGLNERIHQVNNGIDFEVFKTVPSSKLAKSLGVDPQHNLILLHPHRPEPGKGLPETIQVVDRLVNHHGIKQVKVLIPQWIDTMVSNQEIAFYQEMSKLMHDLGVWEHFIFIPWLPQQRMPELYSLGHVTLCLGGFIEAFGNVAYESIACGTPSIVAKVGVHRTMMPDGLIDKVNFGDIDAAADRVREIFEAKRNKIEDSVNYLKSAMNFEHQIASYSNIILNCQKEKPIQFKMPQYHDGTFFKLAPWCYVDGARIFHDFRGRYEEVKVLTELLRDMPQISRRLAIAQGITDFTWDNWMDKTWLVPTVEE